MPPTTISPSAPPIADALRHWRATEAFGQLARFVVAGLGITLFCVGFYLVLAMHLQVGPMTANIASHIAGVIVGYAVHSRWSFRAGSAGGTRREAAALLRFAAGSCAALALNSAWVWLSVDVLAGPAWLPVPAMLFVTPLASFAINRTWVFGRG